MEKERCGGCGSDSYDKKELDEGVKEEASWISEQALSEGYYQICPSCTYSPDIEWKEEI